MMLITECCAGRAIGVTFWTCEQAVRTCSAVAIDVLGLKSTVIHCLESAASICEHPARAASSKPADAATAAPRRAAPLVGSCTPPLYDQPRTVLVPCQA